MSVPGVTLKDRKLIQNSRPVAHALGSVYIAHILTSPTYTQVLPTNPRRRSFMVASVLGIGNISFRPSGYPYTTPTMGWIITTNAPPTAITAEMVGDMIEQGWEFTGNGAAGDIFVIECQED